MPVLCFLIEKDDKHYLWVSVIRSSPYQTRTTNDSAAADLKQDLGMRQDVENVGTATRQTWQGTPPTVRRPLPLSLPDAVLASLQGVFLSHYHWDHSGDVRTVPAHVPVFVGAGTRSGIQQDRLGKHVGNKDTSYLERLEELPSGDTAVLGMEHEGVDFFGDGSLILVPAPGVSTYCTRSVPVLPLIPPLATIPLPLRLNTVLRPTIALPRTHHCHRESL